MCPHGCDTTKKKEKRSTEEETLRQSIYRVAWHTYVVCFVSVKSSHFKLGRKTSKESEEPRKDGLFSLLFRRLD
jgi:hypothetical protein